MSTEDNERIMRNLMKVDWQLRSVDSTELQAVWNSYLLYLNEEGRVQVWRSGKIIEFVDPAAAALYTETYIRIKREADARVAEFLEKFDPQAEGVNVG